VQLHKSHSLKSLSLMYLILKAKLVFLFGSHGALYMTALSPNKFVIPRVLSFGSLLAF
jgi:hypothetical protein